MKASVYTLGCRVNQYESDAIAEDLSAVGFEIVPFGTPCDITVINTCTVTAESDRKSRQFVRRAMSYSPGGKVIITGCFAQASPDEAKKLGADCVVGNGEKDSISDIAARLFHGEHPTQTVGDIENAAYDSLSVSRPKRVRTFVKIEDGCENKCAYCIIPRARGNVRSKAPEKVLEEVRTIAAAGCGEIILTGIETASYGRDLGGYGLAELICDVGKIEGVKRLTLGSLDPSVVNRAFTEKIASVPALLPHFHLSVQSGCTRTLNRMRRKYTAQRVMENMEIVRGLIPDAAFSADVITGFPGETDEDFAESVEFFEKTRFTHLHIFPYSVRRGTEAEKMPDQVPENVRRERAASLSAVQEKIQAKLIEDYISAHADGTRPVHVLCEKWERGVCNGHTEHFIECNIPSDTDMTGRIIDTVLVSAHGAVLDGRMSDSVQNA